MLKKQANQTETEDQVKLEPFMGIRPGIYLFVIYSIILLVALFFLLVNPGLKNPGSVLLVETEPAGAAIRINGVYMGTSGSNIRVPNGVHTIEAVLPGFEQAAAVHEIKGRIFGSLFFPLREKIEFKLHTNDPAGVLAQAAGDFAAWSFGGEPTLAWQIPLSLSEGAYRIGRQNPPEAREILTAASRFAVTRAALRDLIRAKFLLDNAGSSPSPAGLAGSISDILVFLSENPGSAAWLSGLMPPEAAAVIKASAWYQNETPQTITWQESPVPGRFSLNGITFYDIPAGTTADRFMIAENPVRKDMFETFLNENQEWKDSYTNYFEEEIAAFSSLNNEIITGMSWYAAEAFCQWLTKQLPPSMADMEVRLPEEIEWEYAAKTGIISEISGWEWCADPFAPLQFIKAPKNAILAVGSSERSLRGAERGSEARASLPPDFSSPFITFRPVISGKAK